MRADPDHAAAAAKRIAVLFGLLLVAVIVGMATLSWSAFVVVAAIGVILAVVMRFRGVFLRKSD